MEKLHYEAGEFITGNVVFQKDQPMKIAFVRIGLLGEERVKALDDSKGSDKVKSKRMFEFTPVTIFGSKARQEAGESSYPFRVKVPENAAPSALVEGKYHIRYELLAEAGFPNSKDLLSTAQKVQIHATIPQAAERNEPVPAFTEKKSYKFKQLSLRCVTNKHLFLAGDSVELDLSIDNKTTKEISRLIITCEQKIKYQSRKDDSTIATLLITRPKLPIRASSSYQEVHHVELPASCQPTCKSANLQISYQINFLCEFQSGSSFSARMPILVARPREVASKTDERRESVPQVIHIESAAEIERQRQIEEEERQQREEEERQKALAAVQASATAAPAAPASAYSSLGPMPAPPQSQMPQHILDANPNLQSYSSGLQSPSQPPLLGHIPEFSSGSIARRQAPAAHPPAFVVAAAAAAATAATAATSTAVAAAPAASPSGAPVACIPPSVASGGPVYPYGHPIYYGGDLYEPRTIPLAGSTPAVESEASTVQMQQLQLQQQQQLAALQLQQQQLQQQQDFFSTPPVPSRANQPKLSTNSSGGVYPSLDNLVAPTGTGRYSLMSSSENVPPAYNPDAM